MPVLLEEGESYNSCIAWEHRSTTLRVVNCDDTLPFVCFKKKYSVKVVGCGTADSEYAYDSRSGSCYKFHRSSLNWDNAFKECQHEGAYLAVINNHLESIVLQDLYAKNPKNTIISEVNHAIQIHIGIRKNEGTWKTVQKDQTLKEAGYETWGRGEPNSAVPPEDCGSIFRQATFNDENCYWSLPFICEKDPEILYE
ncbi:C-type lectin 21 [Operophtera brumata]|uniref:C-type lectin 21 n=1 Tax=Operophtera brumata TaxID=104452 RepID=A0A0L7LR56_OPEBR|nr:C-type lectin 21 [Operophtera brumata]